MKHLYYVLTARCNEVCAICPRSDAARVKDADPEDSLARLESVLDKNEITDITVSGGEPTLFHGFGDALGLLDRKGIRTVVLSNSMRFSEKAFAESTFGRIAHKENFRLVTAIHSPAAEEHDRVTGVRGSFEKTVQGLNNVLDIGVSVEVKCVVGGRNYQQLPFYPEWVSRTFHNHASLIFCGMDYAGMSREQIERFRVNFREVRPYLEQALDNAAEWMQPGHAVIGEMPLCAVDPYYWGLVSAPNRAGIYDDSHWEKEVQSVSDIRPMAKQCASCKVRNSCSGIWRTQFEEYGEDAVKAFL